MDDDLITRLERALDEARADGDRFYMWIPGLPLPFSVVEDLIAIARELVALKEKVAASVLVPRDLLTEDEAKGLRYDWEPGLPPCDGRPVSAACSALHDGDAFCAVALNKVVRAFLSSLTQDPQP